MNFFSSEVDEAFRQIIRSMEAREARRRAARRPEGRRYLPRKSRNAFIRDQAILREPIPESRGAAELWMCYPAGREEFLRLREDKELAAIVPLAVELCDPDALNGYVAFDKRRAPNVPVECRLIDFVPVHGGIGYHVKDATAAVWGFDTMHVGSEHLPRTDKVWIRAQCLLLYEHLMLCEKHWPEYRRASQKRRIEIVEDIFGRRRPMGELGLPGMMRVMTGDV